MQWLVLAGPFWTDFFSVLAMLTDESVELLADPDNVSGSDWTDISLKLLAAPNKFSGSDLTNTSRKIFVDVDAFPEELFIAPDTIPRFK